MFKKFWESAQEYLDISGDSWMSIFTAAVVWEILHHGLNEAAAAAYASAIAAFAYSNRGSGPKQS